jgi:hypothetical protein
VGFDRHGGVINGASQGGGHEIDVSGRRRQYSLGGSDALGAAPARQRPAHGVDALHREPALAAKGRMRSR